MAAVANEFDSYLQLVHLWGLRCSSASLAGKFRYVAGTMALLAMSVNAVLWYMHGH